MATPSNHWKLGLFVVFGIGLGLVCLVVLGARSLHQESVSYVSYFDESVQGLEVGSPVKFRGVTVGTVSQISIAPDRRHVAVTSSLGVEQITLMGLGSGSGANVSMNVPRDLRIQLASSGLTGVKFAQLDFFSEKGNPLPKLPFPAPKNYVPAAVSTMKNLEDSIVRAVEHFPEMTGAAMQLITRLDRLVDDVDSNHLPSRAFVTLAAVEQAFVSIRTTLASLEAGKVSAQAQATLAHLDATVARMDKLMERVGGDQGVIVSAQRASDAVGDVAVNARGLTDDLGAALRDIQQAAESIQRLTSALERDPDMLLKGRAEATP